MDIPLILSLLSMIIAPVTVLISMKMASNRIENIVEDQKEALFEWFKTEDGMVFVATLGKLFGAGAMSSFKMPKSGGNIDLFGFKIPRQWVESFVMPMIGKELEKRGLGFAETP